MAAGSYFLGGYFKKFDPKNMKVIRGNRKARSSQLVTVGARNIRQLPNF